MKTFRSIFVLFTFLISATIAAQTCSSFYSLSEGTRYEYINYDKKGKIEGSSHHIVEKVTAAPEGTIGTMQIKLVDEKDKELFDTTFTYTCTNENTVLIDYESLIPTNMFEQYENMEMTITGTDIELPNNLSVGQNLADANVTVNIGMGAMSMKTTVDMTNRTVEKKEEITVPAGTFDCYVIYSDTMAKVLISKNTSSSRLWLAEGVGMIKQETYNKKGKLIGYTVLNDFSK